MEITIKFSYLRKPDFAILATTRTPRSTGISTIFPFFSYPYYIFTVVNFSSVHSSPKRPIPEDFSPPNAMIGSSLTFGSFTWHEFSEHSRINGLLYIRIVEHNHDVVSPSSSATRIRCFPHSSPIRRPTAHLQGIFAASLIIPMAMSTSKCAWSREPPVSSAMSSISQSSLPCVISQSP